MNEIKNLNIKLSVNNSLPNLKNFIKNGEMDFSIENMLKVKDLVAKKNLSRKKATKFTQLIIKLINKSVELELIRIYSPQNESNILANLIGILSNFIKFRNIHMKLFKVTKTKIFKKRFCNKKIPYFLSGIFLKLAGKVLTKKIQRRVKSKVIQKGSLARA